MVVVLYVGREETPEDIDCKGRRSGCEEGRYVDGDFILVLLVLLEGNAGKQKSECTEFGYYWRDVCC